MVTQVRIPPELECDFTVVVRKGSFQGQTQFEATHEQYKIILEPSGAFIRDHDGLKEGQTVTARVERMPGNYVAFCKAVYLVRNERGIRPIEAATQWFVDRRCQVEIICTNDGKVERHGRLQKVNDDGKKVVIVLDTGTHDFPHGQFSWYREEGDPKRYMGRGRIDGRRYKIVFLTK